MVLSLFHPLVREWFTRRFEGPTEAQEAGWPAISRGRHTLIAAPTGSGKTLAAFLTCIDRLVRQALEGELPDTTQVVYVSPLKALSNDIQKNLAVPLEEISALAGEMGLDLPQIRAAVRTGDTKPSERQKMARTPPHILITTPESLYILLTSKSGRAGLKDAGTLILDEIHAVADDKRGSHLSLSVERLCALAEGPVTRIGLSATQRPIEEMARFLVGNENISLDGTPDCTIVDTGHAREVDLAVQMPEQELGPIATHELWGGTLDSVADLVRSHQTTLVFVNTRRLAERVAHQLSLRIGEDAVATHHGSLSRTTRLAAEERLKKGEVKVCVATASLELGIDVGVVDLVCQIGSPRSIGLLLQRIGRSGHHLGAVPKGRLFPLTRDELMECTALLRAVRHRNLDILRIPDWPLDVLAQQMVAACSAEDWNEDELYRVCRRAYPYRDLTRESFDSVVGVLSQGYVPRHGRARAWLHRDGVNGRLKGRRGARIAALTSGGAIPDNANYDVVADPEGVFVGTVNEDFAIESMAGDVFLLGNTPWRITRVESGRVRVVDAQGNSPTIPFWLGEAPGRTNELSQEVTELREEIDRRLNDPGTGEEWLVNETGVPSDAAQQLIAYVEEGKRVLGLVPTGRRIVAERFFDETGGMQLVIHSPLGSRINRAWGMALRKSICRTFDFELQASATDDGINFSLGPSLSFPISDVFSYVDSKRVEEVLTQAILQAPIFGTRWRWDATRALAILRHAGGRKVLSPLQRMRSDDLLAAVFPAQVACQDNAPPGDLEVPDHPLVFETMRDCLTEAMDVEGLRAALADMEAGEIEVHARDTLQPSVFAHQILNAMPYAFLDDAPLEERRARSVSLRRALPENARDLGALDQQAIDDEARNAWPPVRDADELHDALSVLGVMPEEDAARGHPGADHAEVAGWLEELAAGGRAYRIRDENGWTAWVPAEWVPQAAAVYPSIQWEPSPPELASPSDDDADEDEALVSLVRGRVECSGPFTADEMAAALNLRRSTVDIALARLEVEGLVLGGRFRPGVDGNEFCDRRILARIHRSTIGRLRKQIDPVPPAALLRFLFRWHHVDPDSRLDGEAGLLDAIEALQGFEAAAGAWEPDLLSARVRDYTLAMVDRLCLEGEVVWGRLSRHDEAGNGTNGRGPLTRNTPVSITLRDALGWLLSAESNGSGGFNGAAGEVLAHFDRRGASFLSEIVAATRRLPADIESALWTLAAAGKVTSDSMEPLRRRIDGKPLHGRRGSRARRSVGVSNRGYSRWSLLDAAAPEEDMADALARQLLRRYGVLCPEILARETNVPRWRELVRLLRRMEARGEIRGGRFVAGYVGEQFALPEAVEMLRAERYSEDKGRWVVVSACDPLNLVGVLTPGERVPATLGNRVAFRDGVPMCSLQGGVPVPLATLDPGTLEHATSLLLARPRRDREDGSKAPVGFRGRRR